MKTDLRHLMAYLRAMEYSMEETPAVDAPKPIITISRQRGGLGTIIAHKTADFLTQQSNGKEPWVVVDRSLAQRVMDDHHLSERLSRFFTEGQTASIQDRVEEMLGLQPSRWTVVEKMAQTMMHLAEIGRVIFVGRAANLVTAHLPQAYHVRVIGSLERRVQRVMESEKLSKADAEALVRKSDYDRSHFVSNYFHVKPDDATLYDLTINTDRVSAEKAVLLILQLLPKSGLHRTEEEKISHLHIEALESP
ncbi:MAG TPA: cytidylate kinase-like family protein [Candidatus Methylacidiphilales bacterium]|nr:cytidylate kinase-like family protein [Candidatus Methylacidiphilales bacterium]